jgi:hypothetical protein
MAGQKKGIMMPAHGYTTVWGTPLGVGRATDVKGWYLQVKAWWAAHKAARHDARIATLKARWDARREAVRSLHADAAIDMVAPAHACSTTTALCDLGS